MLPNPTAYTPEEMEPGPLGNRAPRPTREALEKRGNVQFHEGHQHQKDGFSSGIGSGPDTFDEDMGKQ